MQKLFIRIKYKQALGAFVSVLFTFGQCTTFLAKVAALFAQQEVDRGASKQRSDTQKHTTTTDGSNELKIFAKRKVKNKCLLCMVQIHSIYISYNT